MNATKKPGVLAVMDDATMSMDDQKGDDLREARATVERLAEALEQSQAALRTAATFRYTRATWARDIAAPAIANADAALADFRGDA